MGEPGGPPHGYREHRPVEDLLDRPGMTDITSGLDFELIGAHAEKHGLIAFPSVTQRHALTALGFDRWVHEQLRLQADLLSRREGARRGESVERTEPRDPVGRPVGARSAPLAPPRDPWTPRAVLGVERRIRPWFDPPFSGAIRSRPPSPPKEARMARRLLVPLVLALMVIAVAVFAGYSRSRDTERPNRDRAGEQIGEEQEGEDRGGAEELQEQQESTQERLEALREAQADGTFGRRERIVLAAAPGWAGEQLMNVSTDDWEPAIAADPNAPFVYMLATRYAPKPCPGNCPSPWMALEISSDGGATWSAGTPLCACKGSGQFDPIIEVVPNTGQVYAAVHERLQRRVHEVDEPRRRRGRRRSRPTARSRGTTSRSSR